MNLEGAKIAICNGAFDTMVLDLFRRNNFTVTRPENADIICFTGGADIVPSLYGEERIKGVYCSPDRDAFEIEVWKAWPSKPKIGICRGGQLLNVLSGGSMWQDTDGHGHTHKAWDTRSKKEVRVSSMHHQMMRPHDSGEVLTTARESSYVESAKERILRRIEGYEDIECVWYPSTKSLCYQPHPEVDSREGVSYFFELVRNTIGRL